MPSALECALHIKRTIGSPVDYFHDDSLPDGCFPTSFFQGVAEKEYKNFRSLRFEGDAEGGMHTCDMEERFAKWIFDVSVEDLVAGLESTAEACEADERHPRYEFTPYQRLLMYAWGEIPVTCTARVHVPVTVLRALAPHSSRRAPVEASRCLLAGSFLDVGILDARSGCGKTAMSIAIGVSAAGVRHTAIVREYRVKRLGEVFEGSPLLEVARMVVVAVGATVFDHFHNTLLRMKRSLEAANGVTIEVWTTVGRKTTARIACDLPEGTVVVHLIRDEKLMQVLRQCPDVAISAVVVDEFSVHPPRQRLGTPQSPVLKHVIAQATPQALVSASSGRSFLSEFFEGRFDPPRNLVRCIARHDFSRAQHIANVVCRFDLCTMSMFRDRVYKDIESLMPRGIRVICVKSRRVTITSAILGSTSDLVPASPENVLLHLFREATEASRDRIRRTFQFKPVIIQQLLDDISLAEAKHARHADELEKNKDRLLNRLQEFCTECPVCSKDRPKSLHILPCCGYCMCSDCFCRIQDTCFFCREPVKTMVELVDDGPEPEAKVRIDANDTLEHTIMKSTHPRNCTMINLVSVMSALKEYGHTKILLIIRIDAHEAIRSCTNIIQSLERIGLDVYDVSSLLVGKGTRFSRVKATFDDPNSVRPMVLCSFGMTDRILFGTDLASADALVSVGEIPDAALTQSISRVMRPRAGRDPAQIIPLVRLFT